MALSAVVPLVAAALVISVPAPARAGAQARAIQFSTESAASAAIAGGHDGKTAWLMAHYRQLQVRMDTDPAQRHLTIDLRFGRDAVLVSVEKGAVAVTRGGRRLVLDSPEAIESLQTLLGGSPAIFATRSLLSQLESTSKLKAPDMSLLVAAAFVASLVGDVDAPRRLSDKFMERYRGLFRQVRDDGDSCFGQYQKESSDAWTDLQNCMDETADDGFIAGAYRRLACNAIWAVRSESAWFEFIKCLSPLTGVKL